MSSVNALFVLEPVLSKTCAVKLNVPALVGVPLNTPAPLGTSRLDVTPPTVSKLKLKAVPEYADKEIVSRITNKILTPAAYSEI